MIVWYTRTNMQKPPRVLVTRRGHGRDLVERCDVTSIPPVSGIYQIRCIPTGKIYIGSSKDIASRWRKHRYALRMGYHCASQLQQDWQLYGRSAFVFSILEQVSPEPTRLFEREQAWLDRTCCANPAFGYNTSPVAGATLGVKHTEATRQRMSAWHSGRPKSAEHVRNQALSLAHEWILIDPSGNEHRIRNLQAFCREQGLSAPALCDVAHGKRRSYKGWRCIRVHDD